MRGNGSIKIDHTIYKQNWTYHIIAKWGSMHAMSSIYMYMRITCNKPMNHKERWSDSFMPSQRIRTHFFPNEGPPLDSISTTDWEASICYNMYTN
jgi:hypothetical protein